MRRGRRAGCHHSRSRLQGSRNIHTRRSRRALHKCRMHRGPSKIRRQMLLKHQSCRHCNPCNRLAPIRHRAHRRWRHSGSCHRNPSRRQHRCNFLRRRWLPGCSCKQMNRCNQGFRTHHKPRLHPHHSRTIHRNRKGRWRSCKNRRQIVHLRRSCKPQRRCSQKPNKK